MKDGLHGKLAEDLTALAPYLPAWDALATGQGRPYCAPAWMLSWWRELAPPGARLRVALALDGSELAGIAPCWWDPASRPARLRFLAAPVSSPAGPLAAAGREGAVAPVLAEALAGARPAPRVVGFEGAPSESPWPRLLAGAWPGARGVSVRNAGALPAPAVSLNEVEHFDDWLGRRSRNFRSQARQSRRRLEEAGASRRLVDAPGTIAEALPDLARLHHGRMRHKEGSQLLDAAGQRMLAAAAAELAPAGRLWIWEITGPDGAVASLLFVAAGSTASYWNGGFDDSWARCRPGFEALLAAIEDATERGLDELDLGPGDQPYKRRMADRDTTLVSLSLRPRDTHYPLTAARLAPGDIRRRLALALSDEQRIRVKRLVRRCGGRRQP